MNTQATIERLKQLNPWESDEIIQRMIGLIQDGDPDGHLMLCERFNLPRVTTRKLANDVTIEGYDVYERLETMMDDIGLPCPWPKVE